MHRHLCQTLPSLYFLLDHHHPTPLMSLEPARLCSRPAAMLQCPFWLYLFGGVMVNRSKTCKDLALPPSHSTLSQSTPIALAVQSSSSHQPHTPVTRAAPPLALPFSLKRLSTKVAWTERRRER
jgi:hypothetical protein